MTARKRLRRLSTVLAVGRGTGEGPALPEASPLTGMACCARAVWSWQRIMPCRHLAHLS